MRTHPELLVESAGTLGQMALLSYQSIHESLLDTLPYLAQFHSWLDLNAGDLYKVIVLSHLAPHCKVHQSRRTL